MNDQTESNLNRMEADQRQIERLRKELTNSLNIQSQQRGKIDQKDEHIEDLTNEVRRQQGKVECLRDTIKELEEDLTCARRGKDTDQQATIDALRAELERNPHTLWVGLRKQRDELQNKLEAVRSESQYRIATIAREHQAEVQSLREVIEQEKAKRHAEAKAYQEANTRTLDEERSAVMQLERELKAAHEVHAACMDEARAKINELKEKLSDSQEQAESQAAKARAISAQSRGRLKRIEDMQETISRLEAEPVPAPVEDYSIRPEDMQAILRLIRAAEASVREEIPSLSEQLRAQQLRDQMQHDNTVWPRD